MIPFDGDVFAFLCSLATVLSGGKPQLRKNTKPISERYQRQLLEDSELMEKHRQSILLIERQIKTLVYRSFCTMGVTNCGLKLMRGCQNPADPASWTLTIVEVRTNAKGDIGVTNTDVVSFTTRLAGGKELTTRNMELQSLMDTPPHKIGLECRHVTDLTEVVKRH